MEVILVVEADLHRHQHGVGQDDDVADDVEQPAAGHLLHDDQEAVPPVGCCGEGERSKRSVKLADFFKQRKV